MKKSTDIVHDISQQGELEKWLLSTRLSSE